MQVSDFLDALSGFLDDLCSTPGGASRFSPAVIAVRDDLCGVERAVARVGGGGATFAVAGVPVGSESVLCCLNLRAAWRRSSKLSVVAFVGRTRFGDERCARSALSGCCNRYMQYAWCKLKQGNVG